MHISDGILSPEVATTLAVVGGAMCLYSLKEIKNENIALSAAMSALFFVASFIHIPLGPTQIHLILVGVIGLFLGRLSFLPISIALILQATMLGYGGVTSLGANIVIMALPAYLVHLIFKANFVQKINEKVKFFFVGFLGVFFATVILALVLLFAKDEYLIASYTVVAANVPAMVLEGIITLFLLMYIKKAMPSLLKEYKI
ncbi:cobalamin biosynthesis protein [Malaciobacter halophilus]|uniref:Cobalamin biosynthesis protein n=1 Tax=Malaciobacter halophilus TaxID=197482 RepID=A0A2N1J285_9BACT|nr:cobalt transporter CbiM [Malaciobacter halophilus]AXH10535.1 cobalt/nickel ECF transporter CbiMNQO, S component CbiM [Malaciobacter halophilus]PKI80668.1 cobalamin biosynthesis protein [Malaciobacter halophilus]